MLKSSTINKITKYWYIAIIAMLVIGIVYSYFIFTTDVTGDMNNFNAIPIVIITLVLIIMQKKTYQYSIQEMNRFCVCV